MWGNDEDRKALEEFKGLGLTPEQIRAAVAEKTASETELATVRNESESAKQQRVEAEARATQLQAEVDALKQSHNPPPPDDEQLDFLADPENAIAKTIDKKLNPLTKFTVGLGVNMAITEARSSLVRQDEQERAGGRKYVSMSRLWDKWQTEIMDLAKGMPQLALTQTITWINLFNNVKGRHASEMINNPEQFFTEPGNSFYRRPDDISPDPKDAPLTESELELAKKFRLSPEVYKKSKLDWSQRTTSARVKGGAGE